MTVRKRLLVATLLILNASPTLSSSLTDFKSTLNKTEILSLNETLGFKPTIGTQTFVYGIINVNCPCSRDSFKSFTEVQKSLAANTELVVIDIGASSQKSFEVFKKHLKPTFAFYYDPGKKSVDLFNSIVTPSAYVLKENEIIYQSAVIDPGKNPSPNYLIQAMNHLKQNATAASKKAFGCFILRDED